MPERKRQEIIERYYLEGPSEEALSNLLATIAQLFDIPIALIAISKGDQFLFHTRYGYNEISAPKENTLCTHVVNQEKQIIIPDLLEDCRYTESELFKKSPDLRFYAGTPLRIENTVIGSICLLDKKPRTLNAQQAKLLTEFSEFITHHIRLQNEHRQLQDEHSLLDNSPAVMFNWRYKNGINLEQVTRNVEDVLGLDYEDLITRHQSFETFLAQPSQEEFHFMIQNHLNGVATNETQLELKKEHRSVWIRLLSKAFFSETGRLTSIQAIAIDNTEHRYIENRLSDTNKQMRLLLEASELGTWDYNVNTDQTKVNRRWCDMIGVDYEFYDGSSRFWYQRVHPADQQKLKADLADHLKGETKAFIANYRMRHEAGHWVWIETYGRVVERAENNRAIRVAGTHRDITERKQAELYQAKQSQLLSFINKARAAYLQDHDLSNACQEILPELIDIADSQFAFIGQVVHEEGKKRLFLHAISELSWNSASEALVDLYKGRKLYFDNFDNLFGEVIKSEKVVISNQLGKHPASKGTPTGHPPIYRFMGLPITIQGELTGMIGLANKFSAYDEEDAKFLEPLLDALGGLFYAIEIEKARTAAEEQLVRMAMSDHLSGLNNRRAFIQYTDRLVSDKQSILVMIDIDHFKRINDQYGHEAGDDVISTLAEIMRESISEPHFIARVGGEEFACVLNDLSIQDSLELLETLRQKVEVTEIKSHGFTIKITVSIGAAAMGRMSASKALSNADKALYQAKEQGRNQIVWFKESALLPDNTIKIS